MSYNGIGLSTPRGSATSGFIQRNMSSVKRREPYSTSSSVSEPQNQRHRPADLGILQHEAKRQIENKVLVYRLELEDSAHFDEEVIEEKIKAFRAETEAEAVRTGGIASTTVGKQFRPHETHAIAQSKEAEMNKFQKALGVKDDYEEGTAIQRSTKAKEHTTEKYDPNQEQIRNPLNRRSRFDDRESRDPRSDERDRHGDQRHRTSRRRSRSTRRDRRSHTRSRSRSRRRERDVRHKSSRRRRSSSSTRSHSRSPRRSEHRHSRRSEQERVHYQVERSRRQRSSDVSTDILDEQVSKKEAQTAAGLRKTLSPIVQPVEPHLIFDRRKALGID